MFGVMVLILRIFIAICLYCFLGYCIFTLWHELRLAGLKVATQTVPQIAVYLVNSTQEPRPFQLDEITIGRDNACQFIIPDETVSSYHARLRFHHKQWWLEDLNSTNGTFLNDERIYTPTVIVTGDEVTLGKVGLLIEIKGAK